MPPLLADSSFNFEGRYECSLSRIWQQRRFKQLADELFMQRSSQEDSIIASICLRLPDKSRIVLSSGLF